MLDRVTRIVLIAFSLAACSGAPAKPNSDLALQCELVKCECQDTANPFSRASVVWNQDGTAGCAQGRRLVIVRSEKPSGPGGIVVPTYDECAISGPRTGAGNLGRGARITECGF